MSLKNNIPNIITGCNLISGCIAIGCAMHTQYTLALLFIIIGAVFDFLDGFSARLLGVVSPLGIEMDSLADDVTFGVAPSAILFAMLKQCHYPEFLSPVSDLIPFLAFIMAGFSALRLAKFNLDTRQKTSFLGLPTPANALFWAALVVSHNHTFASASFPYWGLILLAVSFVFCALLVSEMPMFSLKLKSLAWEENKIKYIFLIVSACLLIFMGISGIAAIIIWYMVLSALTANKAA